MFTAMLVLFGAKEAGSFRELATLHSDHLRQVPLYKQLCSKQRHTNTHTHARSHTHHCISFRFK